MKTEWKEYKVEEFAEVIGGGTPNTTIDEFWNGDIPWLTPKDLSSNTDIYVEKGERFITPDGLSNSSAKLLPPDSILLSTRAPVGYLAISKVPLTTNQGFRNLILKEGFSSKFIYYLLKNNISYLQSNASGTTFGELSGSVLKSLKFKIPPLTIQERIADILGALDDKIELNQHMNQTLESMARALFKSWFVDFEPVYAKMEGRDYPLPAEIMDLFPDELVDSELGLIPKGWGVGKLGEEFNIVMGQSPPGHTYNEKGNGLPFYQGRKDFGFRFPIIRMFCNTPTRIAKPGDSLVSVRAPVGDVNMAPFECCIGRGVSAIRHKSNSSSYTYYSMLWLKGHFKQFEAEGTVFGSISKSDFSNIKNIKPPENIVVAFENIVSFLDKKVQNNYHQIETLKRIRNTLLPKLMNGEIEV